jgi:hypothetical protein
MKWVLGFLFLVGATPSFAANPKYDPRPDVKRITEAIENGQLKEQALTAVDSLLITGGEELRARGESALADKLASEWQYYAWSWDLGDHAPIWPWLRDTYEQLTKILGERTMKRLHLTDLHILNHALPVVINPRGRDWDRAEYRKHFVPLVAVISYWGTYLGCRYVIEWTFLRKVCNPAAGAARWWMETKVGPGLSDRVYRHYVVASN